MISKRWFRKMYPIEQRELTRKEQEEPAMILKKWVAEMKLAQRYKTKVKWENDATMGDGMNIPMFTNQGKSVKVKCKLGRKKPTKMY